MTPALSALLDRLPGVLEPDQWSDARWDHYCVRLAKRGRWREAWDQGLHRLMGACLPEAVWMGREAKQWAKKLAGEGNDPEHHPGAYDVFRDLASYLDGAGRWDDLRALIAEAQQRRVGFLG